MKNRTENHANEEANEKHTRISDSSYGDDKDDDDDASLQQTATSPRSFGVVMKQIASVLFANPSMQDIMKDVTEVSERHHLNDFY